MDRNTNPPLLSVARASEKMLVHHDGDASRLLDMVRQAVFFETVKEVYQAIEVYRNKLDVIAVTDRIAERTPMGYGDIRLHIRASNGHVSTVRLLVSPVVAVKADAHSLYVERLCILASARIRSCGQMKGGAVIVVDMFNYMDDDSVTLVTGFPSASDAREYAHRRTRDSVENLRTGSNSTEELARDWLVYGEDCIALAVGTDDKRCALSELDTFVDSPASAIERNWSKFAESFDLRAEALGPL